MAFGARALQHRQVRLQQVHRCDAASAPRALASRAQRVARIAAAAHSERTTSSSGEGAGSTLKRSTDGDHSAGHAGHPGARQRTAAAAAVMAPPDLEYHPHHAWQCKTPLQSLQSEASHTTINLSLGSVDLYGNYAVVGPAVLRKHGNALTAVVKPGGAVSVLQHPDHTCSVQSADLSDGDAAEATCNLMATHLQLEGPYWLTHQTGTQHGSKLVINVNRMSEDDCIMLLPGGSISHPVNVCPAPRR